jgi:hypothetical protein
MTDVSPMGSPLVIALAIIGLPIGISRIREIWRQRGDVSRPARYLRIRYAVLALSLVGLSLLLIVQLSRAPLWVVDLGVALIFGSWGGFLILSIVFGFLEGFRGE